jgi:UDP-glucose 4-epimerase
MSERGLLQGETALVTGATGFIGSRLCFRLLEEGAAVHGVSRTEQEGSDIRWWKADVCDTNATLALVRDAKPDVIFHLASHVSGSRDVGVVLPTFSANLLSTVNVLLGAVDVGCKRVTLAGSLEEPEDEDGLVPVSPYAAAKFAAGAYGRMFQALYDVPVVTLRIFMVYGPGQQDTTKLIPHVITTLLRGESPELSSGQRLVDWIYVDDVVEALVAAAGSDTAVGATIDVGSGVLTSVRAVVEEIARVMRCDAEPLFGALPDRPNERIRVADIDPAQALLRWSPRMPLDRGIPKTVDWYAALHQRASGG